MAEPNSIRAMIAEVEGRLGSIDLPINNAGWGGPFEPVWESDPDQWWRCMEVNLRGPFECCRAVLPGMIARRRGCISSAYVTSKTALIRLSEQLAMEAEPYGVSVFPIRPGIVRTAMVEEARHKLPLIQQMLDRGHGGCARSSREPGGIPGVGKSGPVERASFLSERRSGKDAASRGRDRS